MTLARPRLLLACLAACASPALAQDATIHASLDLGVSHALSRDFRNAPGSVANTDVFAALSVLFPLDERSRMGLSMGTRLSDYSFDNATALAPGFSEGWDSILMHEIGVQYTRAEDPQFSWFVGGSVASQGEAGADFTQTLTYAAFAGVRYKVSDALSLGVAGGLSTRLERSVLGFPVPTVDWKIDEHWSLSTDVGTRPGGVTLAYAPDEQWRFTLSGGLDARAFRLDGQGAAPRGVGRDTRAFLQLGADLNLSQQFGVNARVGVDVWREFEILDQDGVELNNLETDPMIYAEIGLVWRF
jgi:hypothetical protein